MGRGASRRSTPPGLIYATHARDAVQRDSPGRATCCSVTPERRHARRARLDGHGRAELGARAGAGARRDEAVVRRRGRPTLTAEHFKVKRADTDEFSPTVAVGDVIGTDPPIGARRAVRLDGRRPRVEGPGSGARSPTCFDMIVQATRRLSRPVGFQIGDARRTTGPHGIVMSQSPTGRPAPVAARLGGRPRPDAGRRPALSDRPRRCLRSAPLSTEGARAWVHSTDGSRSSRARAAVSAASTRCCSRARARRSSSTTSAATCTATAATRARRCRWSTRSRRWAARRSSTARTSPTGTARSGSCSRRSTRSATSTCSSTTPASCATA